jgi:hypothetical protein
LGTVEEALSPKDRFWSRYHSPEIGTSVFLFLQEGAGKGDARDKNENQPV